MKKTSRSHHGTLNELNITPLLDLAFVLLVIFIITTPQMVNHLEMVLPSGQPPPPRQDAPPPEIQRIVIKATGEVTLNDVPVDLAALHSTLTARKQALPELAVVVSGHDEVEYQRMVGVLDVLQQLDITKVGLATQTP
ncbi:MAG: biopolymer transporter ExbD [Verrucomicrobiales bacterium]|nr:biopolymer transporter ExbD [Verrucomicrobiales bacterium]